MLKRYVSVGIFDSRKGWKQIVDLVSATPGQAVELRCSEDLWFHLITLSDPSFTAALQVVTNDELLKGIMGYTMGMKLTIEKMLRLHTSLSELPSMHYMFFYEQDSVTYRNTTISQATTKPVDLLDLVNI